MSGNRVLLLAFLVLAVLIGSTVAAFSSLATSSSSFEAAPLFPIKMATGSYTGNGSDDRNISVGFQPDIVITKEETNSNTYARFSTMASDYSARLVNGSDLQTNRIQDFYADGFQLGNNNHVNQNGSTYHYVAFKAASGDIAVGSYTGNGVAGRVINSGVTPVLTLVISDNNQEAVFRSSAMTTSYTFDNNTGQAGAVTALGANSFTVGNHATVNQNGIDYYYATFAAKTDSVTSGSFTGNGVDNRDINASLQPEYMIVKNLQGRPPVQRMDTMASGFSINFSGTLDPDRIQNFNANGFQVGTNNDVNRTGDTIAWVAFTGQ